jgi:hypothetical protein
MSKKAPQPENNVPDGVNMDRIKELMGPFPFESKQPPLPKKEDKKVETPPPVKVNTTLSDAAEEANASLKAMGNDLGKTVITPVTDAAVSPMLEDYNSADEASYVSSIAQPEDGAAPVVGEGIVADDPVVLDAVDDIVAKESN